MLLLTFLSEIHTEKRLRLRALYPVIPKIGQTRRPMVGGAVYGMYGCIDASLVSQKATTSNLRSSVSYAVNNAHVAAHPIFLILSRWRVHGEGNLSWSGVSGARSGMRSERARLAKHCDQTRRETTAGHTIGCVLSKIQGSISRMQRYINMDVHGLIPDERVTASQQASWELHLVAYFGGQASITALSRE